MNYDTWIERNPNDYVKVVCQCEQCGCDMHSGEEALIDFEGNSFCSETCLTEYNYDNGRVTSTYL